MIKKFVLASILTASASFAFAQETQEDESKMIREVINVQADKSLFASKTPPPPPAPDKNGKKEAAVPPPEEAAPDTSSSTIPAPAYELAKRAQNWSVDKPAGSKYTKSNCSANGNTAVCQVSFMYKVKELNPTDKVDGEITMTVTIESKEGKYRYTVNNIKHKATVADLSGGDIYANIPACGSMKLSDISWKHIKAAAYADAKMVADDLKAKMDKPSGEAPKKDDW